MNIWTQRIALAAMLATVAGLLSGCGLPNLIAIPFAERDAKEEVAAEYDLRSERLLILPYAGHDVLFEHPGLGYHVGQQVAGEVWSNLGGKVKVIINPGLVERYQQRRLDWPNMPVPEIGREFGADKVLYIELQRFTIMEERSANLYRGRAEARVQVYDTDPAAGPVALYDGEVAIQWPEGQPASAMEIDEGQLRLRTVRRFAEQVIRTFYDHERRVMGEL